MRVECAVKGEVQSACRGREMDGIQMEPVGKYKADRNGSAKAVIRAIVGSDRSWEAVVAFCKDVMVQNELAERLRENDGDSNSLRRRSRTTDVCPLEKDLRVIDTGILSLGVKSSS
ncbi:jg4267 [Pararge aegeria aegeria]|uniref:Jg4267 protein n=1 Tax=Pararge aegeria aegeria TaxID=348720 RepID=A0A8S4QP51_9NEOP|nr:jg4267 [Pararge aegeria aegeria]